jgi:hypothetical protein
VKNTLRKLRLADVFRSIPTTDRRGGNSKDKRKGAVCSWVFGPFVPQHRVITRGSEALVAKVDDHVGFIAADFACPGFFLFFLDFTRWRLHVHPLAAYGHLGFIPTFFAHTHFDFVSHFRLLLNFLFKFSQISPAAKQETLSVFLTLGADPVKIQPVAD